MKTLTLILLLLSVILIVESSPYVRSREFSNRRAYGIAPDFSSIIRVYGKRSGQIPTPKEYDSEEAPFTLRPEQVMLRL